MCFSCLNRLWRENKYTQESSDLLLCWLDRSPMAWIIQWQPLPSPCTPLCSQHQIIDVYHPVSKHHHFLSLSFSMMQLPSCSQMLLLPNLHTTCVSPQQGHSVPLRHIKSSRRPRLLWGTWITHSKGPRVFRYPCRRVISSSSICS